MFFISGDTGYRLYGWCDARDYDSYVASFDAIVSGFDATGATPQ